jgi:hypothetical protein
LWYERNRRGIAVGIKDEAVGRYFTFGEKIVETAANIERLASDFQVLYEHNIDVWKMLDISKNIKQLSDQLEYCTEKIASSSKKFRIDADSLRQLGYTDKEIEEMKSFSEREVT